MGQRILLVEGSDDSTFYQALCREVGLRQVAVKPPSTPVQSKTNAIHFLPLLLQQLADGNLERLGLVVDADYAEHGGLGCSGTLTKIREKLEGAGFDRERRHSEGGFLFPHRDGLAAVGVWIMPDNRSEGMLEDFIKGSIPADDGLYRHACATVARLPERRFKEIHRSKSEVQTWLAWQQIPGKRLECTVGDRLMNLTAGPCAAFTGWLRAVFVES